MDRTKMRPDVLAAIDIHVSMTQKLVKKYFLKKFYIIPRILSVMNKMNAANETYLKARIMDYKVLETMVNPKEVMFIARLTWEIFISSGTPPE